MPTVNRYQRDFDALLKKSGLTIDQLPGLVDAWNKKSAPVDQLLGAAQQITGHQIDETTVQPDSFKVYYLIPDMDGDIDIDSVTYEQLRQADSLQDEVCWHRDPTSRVPVLGYRHIDETSPDSPAHLTSIPVKNGRLELYRIPDSQVIMIGRIIAETSTHLWDRHLELMLSGMLGIWSVLGLDSGTRVIPTAAPSESVYIALLQDLIDAMAKLSDISDNDARLPHITQATDQARALLKRNDIEYRVQADLTPVANLLAGMAGEVQTQISARQALETTNALIASNDTLGVEWLKDSSLLAEIKETLEESARHFLEDLTRAQENLNAIMHSEKAILRDEQSCFEQYRHQWAAGWPENLGPVPPMPTQT